MPGQWGGGGGRGTPVTPQRPGQGTESGIRGVEQRAPAGGVPAGNGMDPLAGGPREGQDLGTTWMQLSPRTACSQVRPSVWSVTAQHLVKEHSPCPPGIGRAFR